MPIDIGEIMSSKENLSTLLDKWTYGVYLEDEELLKLYTDLKKAIEVLEGSGYLFKMLLGGLKNYEVSINLAIRHRGLI